MHFQFEVPLAWNLLWRGWGVRFFTCDGLFPICDIYRQAELGDRPANACESCQHTVDSLFKEYGLSHEKLGKFKKSHDEILSISRSIEDLLPAEIENFEAQGYPIYKWTISSFCTNLRVNGFDEHNDLHVSTLKKYIVGGWLAARLIDRMLDDTKPDVMVLFNGRQSYTKIAFELARRRGIRCICHERAELQERFHIWENATCESLEKYADAWVEWGSIPLSPNEVVEIKNTIYRMSEGKGLNWKSYLLPTKSSRLEDFLIKNREKKVWSLFPSSTDEAAKNPIYWKAFKSQGEWISATLNFVEKNQDIALIIRAHPNSGANQDENNYFKKLKENIPPNVLLIESHEKINSYEILRHTHAGLVFATTLSIEMACRGIPVIAAGNPGWSNCPMVASVDSPSDYLDKLAELHRSKLSGQKLLELVRDAYRLAHAYYFKSSIKFPFLKQLNYFVFALDSASPQDFKPGKHHELDRVVDAVLGYSAIIPKANRIPSPDNFADEETAVRKALAFFRHPEFVNSWPQLAIVLQSREQIETSLSARHGALFSNSDLIEFALCDLEDSDFEELSSRLSASFQHCAITRVKTTASSPAEVCNEAIRQSRTRFLMAPDPSISIDFDMVEKFLLSPKIEEDTIFFGNLKHISTAGTFAVRPPPNITIQILSNSNPLPSSCIFSRQIWDCNNGFSGRSGVDFHWDFWLASAIGGKKFQYIDGVAEVLAKAPDYINPPPPSVVIKNSSVFSLEEINKARVALGFSRADSRFMQSFKNPLDSKLAELKRIIENEQKLTWPTQELIALVQPLLRMRCHELCIFLIEEILAREPGNPSVLKVFSDLLSICGRKEEVPFVHKQMSTSAKILTPEIQKLADPQIESEFFGSEEVANIQSLAEAFQKNPLDKEVGEALRNLRLGLAEHLMGAEESGLQELFAKDYGVVFGLIAGSGLLDSERLPEEDKFAEAARTYFQKLDGKTLDSRFLFVAMLFFRAHEIEGLPSLNAVPEWIEERYFDFLFYAPELFFRIGEAEEYLAHMRRQYAALRGVLIKQPTSPFARKFLPKFLNKSNVIPLYFNEDPLKDIMEVRADLSALALRSMGAILDHKFSKRAAGSKIRIGVLDASVAPRSETYVTLPALRLDRKRFSVQLLSLSPALSPELEGACRKMVDTITVLPREVVKQVAAIRDLDLDVLLIGSNTCAVSNGQFLLSLHRLARLQLVSYCSPVTSGNKNVDAFLSGTLACVPDSQEQFAERLLQIPGPPGCMDYDHDRKPAVRGFTKSDFGVPEDSILFVSGANCFKILPEMQEVWAEILEKVPGSRLLLHPFNPNWTNKYPELRFQESFFKTLSRRGIDLDRLVVSTHKLPTRSDVVAMMSIGDVYLDTFPYSGSISLTDPLETGVPTLVCEDKSLRSRQGAALLRDIGMEELVTTNADEYITKAIELSNDLHKRNEVRAKIQAAVAAKPRYLDPKRYGRQLGRMLEKIVREGLDAWNPEEAERDEQREISTLTVEPKSSAFQPISATLEEAVSAFTEGRLSDAEDICREILAKDERCAGAWHLMGKMAALQGDLETAAEFASVACELDPQNAEFVRELAEVFLRKKELDLAEQQVRRALEMAPDSPEGLVLLGRILAEKDDKSASLEAFQDALRLRKDYAEGFSHYATALQKFGRGKDAISQIRKACALEPDSVEFQTNLAILLEQNARYVDALAAYGKAARMNPNVGFVWFRQGKLLNGLKRYAESIPALAKAISLPGQLGDYHYEYGLALHMSKRFQEALVHYEKALSMGYNTAALQCNRGVIYKDLRKGGDAIMAFHAAVKMDPSNVSYLNNLGAAALELGLNTEALECFEQAVEKNPKLPTARNNIGNLLKDRARGMDALPQYRKSMELNPDDRDAPSNYLLCHMYIPDMDPKLVFEEHKKWGISTTKKFPPAFKFKPREAGAKIRVGFLSADLCHHPVAHFIEPIFRGYDRERFEVVAYGDQRKSDEFSARFAKQVDLWRETSSYDDRALAKLIHEDRIDILFELAGHTAYNRLGVFALKPAPVQVSYLGYPGTTGLPTMDFRITDAFADPQGTTEHLHTEKLIRVPECAWCFEPDASAPEIEPLPALKNGFVTFGCFNNMAKLNPSLFETWAEILLRVPGSHLRLKARTLTDDGVRKELKSYFTERGIEEDRLDFFGHTKKIADHLNHYQSVDIALDSFPYHGTTTTCEAMWMGSPVVTRAGKTHVSRVGVSLLSAVGLQEFITDTREAYIEKAVALAAQTDRLQELRSGMRDRLRNSVLMDEKRFVQGFEKALMEMANLGGLMRP